ncbi:MAG: hypothetical protein JW952_07740 [Candidatus Eisenbacteria bacterium]|nr:hypothetical protein [Candidatus Eisenbacteria bacterium]
MAEATEPEWLTDLKRLADPAWVLLLDNPGGAVLLADQLPAALPAGLVAQDGTKERQVWEWIGVYYRANQRWYDAIAIYTSMYNHFLRHQMEDHPRVHKGMPLVWIADCYASVGNIPLSKRYLMLTLIEDAITMTGVVDPVKTGSYFRLAWRHGLPDIEIKRYAAESLAISGQARDHAVFPEFVLQQLDRDWLLEVPTANDAGIYVANTLYIEHLMRGLSDASGRGLENLADYLLSCIPGCRTAKRQSSYSTDYDVVCSLEGPDIDFRSDFGRYFVCECKDWENPAGFTEFAKFARVFDSIKARFGILFSRDGISGAKGTTDARREQLKVFQDRGLVIIVVDIKDLEFIAKGVNFISMLRRKYEEVRLDLPPSRPADRDGA